MIYIYTIKHPANTASTDKYMLRGIIGYDDTGRFQIDNLIKKSSDETKIIPHFIK